MQYPTGTVVIDPDTGYRYTYRPDIDPDAPFEREGEQFTLAGVEEQEA